MAHKANKVNLSYADLTSGKVSHAEIDKLGNAGRLTKATLARLAHLGRFFTAVANVMPNSNLKVGDILSEADLQKLWRDTADRGAVIGCCPITLH